MAIRPTCCEIGGAAFASGIAFAFFDARGLPQATGGGGPELDEAEDIAALLLM